MRKRFTPILGTVLVLASLLALAPARRTESFGDPIGNYNFRVEIDGVVAGHFTAVGGLSIEQEVIEYQNGDDPLLRKRPGRVKYGDITLKRGYVADSTLNDWIEEARLERGENIRKDITITLVNRRSGEELKRWNCYECFPTSWRLTPVDSKKGKLLTEEVVVAIEWFEEA